VNGCTVSLEQKNRNYVKVGDFIDIMHVDPPGMITRIILPAFCTTT